MAIISLCIGLFACKTHCDEPTNQEAGDYYENRAKIAENLEFFDVPRCDRLTVYGISDAFLRAEEMDRFEVSPGRWERDGATACYPDESESTVSREGILAAFHSMLTRHDDAGVSDLWRYAKEHGGDMGEGPFDLVNIWPAAYILRDAAKDDAAFRNVGGPLNGFRGYVLALGIHASGRVHGSLNEAEYHALKALVDDMPNNPVARALLARYDDGDQSAAMEILDRDCPGGDCQGFELWHWPSVPNQVVYAWVVSIFEGR